MNELKFPFKFTVLDGTYIADLLPSGKPVVINVHSGEQFFGYTEESIADYVSRGGWKIVEYLMVEQDPEVTIRQSEVDAYIDEINMLRELVAEITAETDYTALGQQAQTYRALNEKMTKHPSYKQGDSGSTRESELLEQLDVLFEAYDNVVCVEKEEEQTFKPISEMTLEDWQQAKCERWVFSTYYMGDVTVYGVDRQPQDLIPILVEDLAGSTWYVSIDGTDIDNEGWTVVKRIK